MIVALSKSIYLIIMNKKIVLGVISLVAVIGTAGVSASVIAARSNGMDTTMKTQGGLRMGNATSTMSTGSGMDSAMKNVKGKMQGKGMMGGNATSTMMTSSSHSEAMDSYRKAVDAAIQAGDYTAWKSALSLLPANGHMGDMISGITKDNFSKFVEMHKLTAQADAMRKDLGLGMHGDMESMHGDMESGMRGNAAGH